MHKLTIEKKLQRKAEILENEMQNLDFKPKLDKKSKLIIESKKHVPIHLRASTIVDNKREKIEKKKAEIQEKIEKNQPKLTFKPNLNKKSRNDKLRTVEEFNESMINWQKRKEHNLHQMESEKIENEIGNLSFQPKIDVKSKKMISLV